jgi:chromosome segregation ATPase
MRILDLLRGEKPPNPASLRGALADAEAERGAAVQALDRLQQRHAELLLDGDDRALDTLERDLAQAQRRADRLDLLIMQAQERLREAEAAERQAELDALFARGEALAAEGVELIKKQYPPLARKVLELAERLELIDREIAELNRRLAEAGDPRRVRDYDAEARPVEPAEP